jgi:hypothetical protein
MFSPCGALRCAQELSNPQAYGPLSSPHTAVPPYSCRSGLAVSLSSYSESQGVGTRQFSISVSQRLAEGGGSRIHVAALTPRTLDQVRDGVRARTTHLTGPEPCPQSSSARPSSS